MPGCCTFTATSRPPWRARWTWPIEAAANGSCSNASNSDSARSPSSSRTTSATRGHAIAVLWDWSCARTRCASGGSAPGM